MYNVLIETATGRQTFNTDKPTAFGSRSVERNLRTGLTWSVAYALVSYFTGAYFMADTVDYAADAAAHELGVRSAFWEFGHLFWRPLGWALLHAFGPWIRFLTGPNPRIEVTHIFVALNWIAGLACILLFRAVLLRLSIRPAIANVGTLALLFSNAFLNFIHSGSPYIPGLAFLLLGFYLLGMPLQSEVPPLQPIWAASALAMSVCLWFPYVFAVPGILATPLFNRRVDQSRGAFTFRAMLYCLAFGLVAYGSVLTGLRIFTMDGVHRWVGAEASAIGGVAGPSRLVFGFARSFINMGTDGVLFKRLLLRDPYNSVSFFDLLRVSLFKLVLFYGLLVLVVRQLLHSANRKIFWLCMIIVTPVLLFALFWYGGDAERYLPLYPAFFLALASSLEDDYAPVYLKWIGVSFLLVSIFANLGTTSKVVLRYQRRHVEERIKDIMPLMRPGSRLILVDIHDELENFQRSFPFDPIVRGGMLRTHALVNPGTPQTIRWRQEFASAVQTGWAVHGDIWISKRILEPSPHRDWSWVDGADPNVPWSMIRSYFTQLDYGRSVGGEDGFLLLLPTEKNEAVITSFQPPDALEFRFRKAVGSLLLPFLSLPRQRPNRQGRNVLDELPRKQQGPSESQEGAVASDSHTHDGS